MRFVQFFHGAYFLKIGKLRTLIHKLSFKQLLWQLTERLYLPKPLCVNSS
jgi:hypothetical protein